MPKKSRQLHAARTPLLPPASYAEHKARWHNGCGSEHCSRKGTRVVLARGTVPCDVLVIGEAPGESENVVGRPFVGPAGKLLDLIVERALADRPGLTVAFTNVVACIPRDDSGEKWTEPDEGQIAACAERLQEFARLADPRLVVRVGKVAGDWVRCDPSEGAHKGDIEFHKKIPTATIVHPAFILRSPTVAQSQLIKRCVLTVREAVERL